MTTGSILAYLLQSALFLAAGYVIYKLMLSRIKMPAFNRAVILAVYAASLLAPALINPGRALSGATSSTPVSESVLAETLMDTDITSVEATAINYSPDEDIAIQYAPAGNISPLQPSPAVQSSPDRVAGNSGGTTASRVACALALAGGAVILLQLLYGMVAIIGMSRNGELRKIGRIRIVLLDNSHINPFSLLNLIFIARRDYFNGSDMIIQHELGHIRNFHFIDLLMSKLCIAVMWWNPAAWLLNRELRAVHEYQADDNVLRTGHDIREYQMLLINKAAGTKLATVASSLNHSKLKQRFTMMYQQNPTRWARLRAAALLPAFCGVAIVASQNSFATIIAGISETTLKSDSDVDVTIPITTEFTTISPDNDLSGSDRYLSLTLPPAATVQTDATSLIAMADPRTEPEPAASATAPTGGNSTPVSQSVWDLDVLKSHPRSINVNVFDADAGSPTINGVAVTFDQMEEYLRDTGNTSHLTYLNKMRKIHERKKSHHNTTDWQRFVRTDDDDDDAIITVINEGENQTIYITPTPQKQQDRIEKRSGQQYQQLAGQARLQSLELRAQSMEARAQAEETQAQFAKTREEAAAYRKNAATLRKEAAKLRKTADKERRKMKKQFGNTYKFNELSFSSSEFKQLQALDSLENLKELNNLNHNLSQLSKVLEDAEKKLNSFDQPLNDHRETYTDDYETPATEKLSGRFIRLDNTDGTNVQVMVTSTAPLQIGSATMMINGKRYKCSVKTVARINQHADGVVNTLVKVHTRKLTTFSNNDYVSIITDRGTVKVALKHN
ncbi:MAG: hypothetical protein K2L78_05035 [Muribaculaceae bacterium]|nr:hypothetical protein [Muribaculaceae bacterium]